MFVVATKSMHSHRIFFEQFPYIKLSQLATRYPNALNVFLVPYIAFADGEPQAELVMRTRLGRKASPTSPQRPRSASVSARNGRLLHAYYTPTYYSASF